MIQGQLAMHKEHSEEILRNQMEIRLPFGLPGFESLTRFLVAELVDFPPFHFLQSLEERELGMLLLDVNLIQHDENISLMIKELEKRKIDRNSHQIFLILKLVAETRTFTANIRAPFVVEPKMGSGSQIILENQSLGFEYPLDPDAF